MEKRPKSTRRNVLKSIGAGAGAFAGLASVSSPAAAYYSSVGDQWEKGRDYHCDNCYYPTAIGGDTMPIDSSIDIVAEKTGGEMQSTPDGDVRIHEFDIEVLLTSAYDLWEGNFAQQIQEVSVSLDGQDGADVQVWEDGDIGTVISGPARDESEIDQTADQIEESDTGFDDTIVALSEIVAGRTSTIASTVLDAASMVNAVINEGGEDSSDSKTYRWDYSVPIPEYDYLNPQQSEYYDIDQTYAVTIYLTGVRVGMPVDESSGTLQVSAGIDGYGMSSSLNYDMWIGNDPTTGGL